MKEWVLIEDHCPECLVGSIFAVKNKKDNNLCVFCEECTTLWRCPEDIEKQIYFDNWKEEFEWGGYATLEEVKNFGWEKYIKQ